MSILAEIDFGTGIEDAWSKVATFVPRLVAFLVVLVIGYIVVKFIARAVDKILERVGFDELVERGMVKQALDRSQYDASDIMSKVVFYALMLMLLQVAFGVFGANAVSDMLDSVVAYLPKVFVAIVIVLVASAIASGVRELLTASLGGLSYARTAASAASVAIIAVGAFAALNQLQVAPEIVNGLFYAVLAVVAGSAIIAIGGGGIHPMQERWTQALRRYDEEKPRLQQQVHDHQRAGTNGTNGAGRPAASSSVSSDANGAHSTTTA